MAGQGRQHGAAAAAARWFIGTAIGGHEIDPRDPGSGRGKVGHSKRATTPKGPFYYRASRAGPVIK